MASRKHCRSNTLPRSSPQSHHARRQRACGPNSCENLSHGLRCVRPLLENRAASVFNTADLAHRQALHAMLILETLKPIEHLGQYGYVLGKIAAEILRMPPQMERAAGNRRFLHRLRDAGNAQNIESSKTTTKRPQEAARCDVDELTVIDGCGPRDVCAGEIDIAVDQSTQAPRFGLRFSRCGSVEPTCFVATIVA